MPKFIFKGIHAGGLLFFDDVGIWVIKEYYRNSYKFIDPGGKYSFQDCDILHTILREFNEETYFILDHFAVHDLKKMLSEDKAEMIYVCPDSNNNPTYACLIANINDLNIDFDLREKFFKNRNETLSNNPLVPSEYYTSFDLCRLSYSELKANLVQFHYRLKQILIGSFLSKYI